MPWFMRFTPRNRSRKRDSGLQRLLMKTCCCLLLRGPLRAMETTAALAHCAAKAMTPCRGWDSPHCSPLPYCQLQLVLLSACASEVAVSDNEGDFPACHQQPGVGVPEQSCRQSRLPGAAGDPGPGPCSGSSSQTFGILGLVSSKQHGAAALLCNLLSSAWGPLWVLS